MRTIPIHEVDRFREFVAVSLGLHFGQDALDHIATVFADRLHRTGCDEPAVYWAQLRVPGRLRDELRQLASDLTVGETYFFRHPEQYQAFAEIALPQCIAEQNRRRPLRILSAGCASGEEAYSLAAIVRRTAGAHLAGGIEILGIDVNPIMLEKARRARYSAWSLRATSDQQKQCCFRPDGREFVLQDAIRTAVNFEERNLLDADSSFWAPGAFDLVFCRNVMIYFAPETIKAVVARIAGSLAPGGFLCLGPSETLRGISPDFHLRHTHGAFYYQRRRPDEQRSPALVTAASDRADPFIRSQRPLAFNHNAGGGGSWFGVIGEASERIAALAQRSRATGLKNGIGAGSTGQRSGISGGRWDLSAAKELLRQERFADVMEALGALPRESDVDPDVLLLRAVVLTNGGKLDEAEQICLRVLAIEEMNAGAHYLRALCREHAGDKGSAIEHDQTAIYLDPTFAMPRLHLGLMAQRSGDADTACRELRQALLLLSREDAARILLFGGGFHRESLVQLCRTALQACGSAS